MLQPWDKGLVGTTLRYHYEVREFEDRYENAVVEMLQRKRAGMSVPTERIAAPAPNVVSLRDALKRSLATEAANAVEQPREKAKKSKKRAAGQREMLLPIAGTAKEAAKEKTKEPARPATVSGRPANAYAPRSLLPKKGRRMQIPRGGGRQ